jgi:hypothetical protein
MNYYELEFYVKGNHNIIAKKIAIDRQQMASVYEKIYIPGYISFLAAKTQKRSWPMVDFTEMENSSKKSFLRRLMNVLKKYCLLFG